MNFLRSGNVTKYLRSPDGQTSWAMVTGASDGIGAGFAQELAAHGFNLMLHGRNPDKLGRVRDALLKDHRNVHIRTVVADASKVTPSMIEDIVQTVKMFPITVLINNVGGASPLDASFKTFATHTITEMEALINLNIRFTLLLTHALLPILKANGPTLLMNIGSQGATGLPYLSVYGATKGFIRGWTRGLQAELAGEGDDIEVIEIIIGSVQTNQNQTDKPTLFVPSSRTMAQAALATAGKGSNSVAAYWPHSLQLWALWSLPTWVFDKVAISMLKPLAGKKERRW